VAPASAALEPPRTTSGSAPSGSSMPGPGRSGGAQPVATRATAASRARARGSVVSPATSEVAPSASASVGPVPQLAPQASPSSVVPREGAGSPVPAAPPSSSPSALSSVSLLYDDVAAEAKAALASLGFPGTSTPAGPVDLSVTGASGKHLAVQDGAVLPKGQRAGITMRMRSKTPRGGSDLESSKGAVESFAQSTPAPSAPRKFSTPAAFDAEGKNILYPINLGPTVYETAMADSDTDEDKP